ncbi:hypothetical protein Bbelb_295580 [Branchiostoma belcheri]|nr:hypothetical protein Bbelb_295580 [Branchiostoma belcheri]
MWLPRLHVAPPVQAYAPDRRTWARDCTTFNTALRALQSSQQRNGWITNVPQNQNFIIRQISVNSNNKNSAGYYTNAEVKVAIFGDDYTFTLSSAISPSYSDQGGRLIAKQALNIYKSRHPFTGN